jgi:hypothetical protein
MILRKVKWKKTNFFAIPQAYWKLL